MVARDIPAVAKVVPMVARDVPMVTMGIPCFTMVTLRVSSSHEGNGCKDASGYNNRTDLKAKKKQCSDIFR